jgi:ribokinase/sulfofructose kinase
VVDPTGAGDAFTAGLVDAWLLEGRPAREAGRFAAAAAALNCTGDGARGGLATRAEVERLVTDQSLGPGGETE